MIADSNSLPVVDVSSLDTGTELPQILFVGNPNAGKTSLFNALTGLRARTANYPGITVEYRKASVLLETNGDAATDLTAELVDLPGLYSMQPLSPEEAVAVSQISSTGDLVPALVLLVLDATNLVRNLYLVEEVLQTNQRTLVALNMMDEARSKGISVDVQALSDRLGCSVIPVSARTGEGISELKNKLVEILRSNSEMTATKMQSCCDGCQGCPAAARHNWAERICFETVTRTQPAQVNVLAVDRWLTSPLVGLLALLTVMMSVFVLIFSLADLPMSAIDNVFGRLANLVNKWIPEELPSPVVWFSVVSILTFATIAFCFRLGKVKWKIWSFLSALIFSVLISSMPLDDFRSLVVDGVIGGVSGVVVFLPQIVILFFFIALLEDSGYFARAAFVMERWMRKVGLPGKAFVPMLSAHACAIPGIMATRTIENRRDRLVTILVLPLLTCSARLPVYAMISALLFAGRPLYAALTFLSAYLIGLFAALATAFALKRTVLPGEASPLVIELPPYRIPALRNALLAAWDRAMVFLRSAGTVILLISVILWAMATYPRLPEQRGSSVSKSERAQLALEYSMAGRVGRFVEPVFEPLGFDWKINVGVISSFAAREVLVSTMSVIYGVETEDGETDKTLVESMRDQKRTDGKPVFTTATSISLLIFYVLAMQCLPTQVVTRRETGSWKWAVFQFIYMTVLAWCVAAFAFQSLNVLGMHN